MVFEFFSTTIKTCCISKVILFYNEVKRLVDTRKTFLTTLLQFYSCITNFFSLNHANYMHLSINNLFKSK